MIHQKLVLLAILQGFLVTLPLILCPPKGSRRRAAPLHDSVPNFFCTALSDAELQAVIQANRFNLLGAGFFRAYDSFLRELHPTCQCLWMGLLAGGDGGGRCRWMGSFDRVDMAGRFTSTCAHDFFIAPMEGPRAATVRTGTRATALRIGSAPDGNWGDTLIPHTKLTL
jgi:hypothetical protein